ncbi:MAG: AI-2E family transporter [Pseudomonadota bacterium]
MSASTETAPSAPASGRRRSAASRIFFNIALAVLIGYLLYLGRSLLIPLIAAAFLSFLIFTLKEAFRRAPMVGSKIPDWLAYIFAFVLIFSVIFLFVEIVRINVEDLIEAAPDYRDRLRDVGGEALTFAKSQSVVKADFIYNSLEQIRAQALGAIEPFLRSVAGSARAILTNTVIIFLYTVFILVERARIFKKISLLSDDPKRRAAIDETINDIGVLVRQYITVKTLSNLFTAGASFLIMTLIGVDFAGFWALLIFGLNYIPVFGAASAIGLPVLLALVQPDGGVQKMVLTLALLIGVEQIMSNGIEPRIVGKSLNLSPLIVLISLAFWGSIWGFAGFLLSVPMTVSVMLILTQFHGTRPIAIMMSENGVIADLKHP